MTLRELVSVCTFMTECSVAEVIQSRSDPNFHEWRPFNFTRNCDFIDTAQHILNRWPEDILDLEVRTIDVPGGLHGRLGIDVIRWIP